MARKPPHNYKYKVGDCVNIDCYSESECGRDFIPDAYATAARFAATKGFGNTGAHLVKNRTSDREGIIMDRTDGLYIVSSIGKGENIQYFSLCAEIELTPVEAFSDAVVRWLGEGNNRLSNV